MSAKVGKRRCVFCGGGPVSREHIWPQWLRRTEVGAELYSQRVYDDDPHVVMNSAFGVNDDGELHAVIVPELRGRSVPTLDLTAKVPCRGCNNGWMSKLENEAKPIIERLMSGEPATVSLEEAKTLTRWAMKTSAIYEFNHPPTRTYSREVLRAIAAGEKPPGVWLVGLVLVEEDQYFRMSHFGGDTGRREDLEAGRVEPIAKIGFSLLAAGPVGFIVRYTSDSGATNLVDGGFDDLEVEPSWIYVEEPMEAAWPTALVNDDTWLKLVLRTIG